jgi:hypothetical protein
MSCWSILYTSSSTIIMGRTAHGAKRIDLEIRRFARSATAALGNGRGFLRRLIAANWTKLTAIGTIATASAL